jgi:hypothetical protein
MIEKLEVTEFQIRRMQDYWTVFSTLEGIRVLEDMEKEYCSLPYTIGDTNDTFRKIGMMEVVLDIKRMMEFKNREIQVIKEEEKEE